MLETQTDGRYVPVSNEVMVQLALPTTATVAPAVPTVGSDVESPHRRRLGAPSRHSAPCRRRLPGAHRRRSRRDADNQRALASATPL